MTAEEWCTRLGHLTDASSPNVCLRCGTVRPEALPWVGPPVQLSPIAEVRHLLRRGWALLPTALLIVGIYSLGHQNQAPINQTPARSKLDPAYVDRYIHAAPASSFATASHSDGSATLTIMVPMPGNPSDLRACMFDVDSDGNAPPGTPIRCT